MAAKGADASIDPRFAGQAGSAFPLLPTGSRASQPLIELTLRRTSPLWSERSRVKRSVGDPNVMKTAKCSLMPWNGSSTDEPGRPRLGQGSAFAERLSQHLPQRARHAAKMLAGTLIIALHGCAAPVEIDDDVQVVPFDTFDGGPPSATGGAGGTGGTGTAGSGQGGSAPLGGTGGSATPVGNGGSLGLGGAAAAGAMNMGGAAGTSIAGAAGEGTDGSAAGAAGADGAGGTDTGPVGNCVEAGSVDDFNVQVFYTDNSPASTISMVLAVRNEGATYPTSDLTLRYWFTPGTTQEFTFTCDYAVSATNVTLTPNVGVTFGTTATSAYAEISIDSADDIGAGIDTLQLRLYTPMFSALTHTDDFSYIAAANNVVNENISAYVGGVQVFGCEPP